MRRSFDARLGVIVVVAAIVAGACGASAANHSAQRVAIPSTTTAPPATFVAHGSVNQVWLTGAPASTPAALFGPRGLSASAATDAQGSLIFRNVAAGDGYRVVVGTGAAARETAPVRVTTPDQNPAQSFYAAQHVVDGYQYLTTRDGTTLSIMVRMPGPIDKGPYPTVIEYSGYSPADPNSPQPSTLIASNLGYATVGINIRGTGCSGGAFQFFEPLQGTDGYDAIEAVAAQPWVLHHRVGMIGISYPGISQLFVAQHEPPHLAAIAPLSVIDDTYRGTLYPGGVLNNGFAVGWAQDRQHDAQAAPASGQAWAGARINGGDTTCLANQALRGQTPDVLKLVNEAKFYERAKPIVRNEFQSIPTMADLAPATFVHKINVPVFLSAGWQDEQTGAHAVDMLNEFSSAPVKRFVLQNGNHTEPLTPTVFMHWFEFLEFYVAERIPVLPSGFRALAPAVFSGIFGPVAPFGPDRFAGYPSYAAARKAYEAEPEVRILFENGAGCPTVAVGSPCSTFERDFPSWPIPSVVATSYYLGNGGELSTQPTASGGVDAYSYAGDGQKTTFSGSTDQLWKGVPPLDWQSDAPGTAASYVSAPLSAPTVMAGTGRVDLWIRADAPDVDLQVQLTEVRADGTEYAVQDGWLRASHRKLLAGPSNALRAVPTDREVDAAPLPAGQYTEVSVEIFPFAHLFHAGSRIRLIVDVPGGTRPFWKFNVLQYDHPVTVDIGHGPTMPATITLPVVPGAGDSTPAALPPCPSLRGQACRTYVPFVNTTG